MLSDTARYAVARYGEFESLGQVTLGPSRHEVFRLVGWKDRPPSPRCMPEKIVTAAAQQIYD